MRQLRLQSENLADEVCSSEGFARVRKNGTVGVAELCKRILMHRTKSRKCAPAPKLRRKEDTLIDYRRDSYLLQISSLVDERVVNISCVGQEDQKEQLLLQPPHIR